MGNALTPRLCSRLSAPSSSRLLARSTDCSQPGPPPTQSAPAGSTAHDTYGCQDHPHFTDEETEALSLAQGQLRRSRGGNNSEPHCPMAPCHPKDQSVQPLPTDPLPLGARRAGSAGGSSGLWAESPRIPHLLAQRLLWAEQQRPTAGHAVQEGPRGVRASICPAVNWWHWTRWPWGAFSGLRTQNRHPANPHPPG